MPLVYSNKKKFFLTGETFSFQYIDFF